MDTQFKSSGKDSFDDWRESVSRWYAEKGMVPQYGSPGEPVYWLSPSGTWIPLTKSKDIKAAVKGKL